MKTEKTKKILLIICVFVLLIITATVCMVSCVAPEKGENTIINNYNITVTDGAAKYRYAAEKAIQSSVLIKATLKADSSYAMYKTINILSSGAIITDDGYILTNQHSLSYSGYSLDTVKITTFDKEYNETSYNAELVIAKGGYELDISILKINDAGSKKFVPVSIGNSDELKMGIETFMLGNSAGSGLMLSGAVIAHPLSTELEDLNIGTEKIIKINANVNQGLSIANGSAVICKSGNSTYLGGGSGLYDTKGNYVGMVSYRKAGKDNTANNLVMGIGYAIRTVDIQKVISECYSGIKLTLAKSDNVE